MVVLGRGAASYERGTHVIARGRELGLGFVGVWGIWRTMYVGGTVRSGLPSNSSVFSFRQLPIETFNPDPQTIDHAP